MKKISTIVFVFALFLPFNSLAEELNFVSIQGLIEQEVGGVILPEIYKKIGVNIVITPSPGKRAQALATSGKKDGEIMRIWTYGENNPTVVRVETPYYALETMGFIKEGSGVEIKSKEDLAKYKVGKVIGVKHTDNISKDVPKDQVVDMSSTKSAMQNLMKGRLDVVLTNTTDGMMVIKKNGFEGIVPISQPLAVLDLYNYVHESKAAIVPKVDAAIKEMKASGELATIVKQAEAQIIGAGN